MGLEEAGIFLSNPSHWELWRSPVYIHTYHTEQKYVTKKGEEKIASYNVTRSSIIVPKSIVEHLKLKNKEMLYIAICRKLIHEIPYPSLRSLFEENESRDYQVLVS